MIDILLLTKIACLNRLHRFPNTIKEAIGILGTCIGVLKYWEMLNSIPHEKIGSETHAREILAEYMKCMYERRLTNRQE